MSVTSTPVSFNRVTAADGNFEITTGMHNGNPDKAYIAINRVVMGQSTGMVVIPFVEVEEFAALFAEFYAEYKKGK